MQLSFSVTAPQFQFQQLGHHQNSEGSIVKIIFILNGEFHYLDTGAKLLPTKLSIQVGYFTFRFSEIVCQPVQKNH